VFVSVKDLAVIDRILARIAKGSPQFCCAACTRRSGSPTAVTPWFAFTGLQSTGHGPQAPIDISFVAENNPITKGLANWTTINEELYNNSAGKLLATATPLARGQQTTKNREGKEATNDFVVAWTNDYQGTKVFATTLGHNNLTVADPRYLDLVTRGLLWSCGKLNDDYLKPAVSE
jgi:type 1 glutamine amidotransferase